MMLKFSHVLDHCREQVVALATDDTPFELEVIDRWKNHADVDRAWEQIDRAATQEGKLSLPPEQLVEWVLEQSLDYRRIVREVIPNSQALEQRVITIATREWRETANGMGGASAGLKRDLAIHHRQNRTRVLGRQPNPRKLFIKQCRELFVANCGQPLDSVTEVLVFVVFGSPAGDNEVRDALKPSTRAGRTPKRKIRR